jgi:hypothetical protein
MSSKTLSKRFILTPVAPINECSLLSYTQFSTKRLQPLIVIILYLYITYNPNNDNNEQTVQNVYDERIN